MDIGAADIAEIVPERDGDCSWHLTSRYRDSRHDGCRTPSRPSHVSLQ
jgi:hypothetical protein